MHRPKPVILTIVSGFGIGSAMDRNAIRQANLPIFHHLTETYPAMSLTASGTAVGLEDGANGTSEAGHRTVGTGRVLYDPVPRVSAEIASSAFFSNSTIKRAYQHVQKHEAALHLVGLVSEAELHSKMEHLEALLTFAKREHLDHVYVHVILDGEDTMRDSGAETIRSLERRLTSIGIGSIASISGRSWAMDHTGQWERIRAAYEAIALGRSISSYPSAEAAIKESYANGVFDCDVVPTVILQQGGVAHMMRAGDACVFFNLQAAPMRELVQACTLPSFDAFVRHDHQNVFFLTLIEYDRDLPIDVAYPEQLVEASFGEIVSRAGLKQLRVAETERYAHATYYFNGMRNDAFPGEDRVIIPSPNVSKYDQVPEMSTAAITERVIKEIALGSYDVIIVTFAAPDLVAQTGDEPATMKACEAVDKALGKIVEATLALGGVFFLVSDHGHAEVVRDPTTDEIIRLGTRNPVPFLAVGRQFEGMKAPSGDVVGGDFALTSPSGSLVDVAPTMLRLLGLPIPPEMMGRPLV